MSSKNRNTPEAVAPEAVAPEAVAPEAVAPEAVAPAAPVMDAAALLAALAALPAADKAALAATLGVQVAQPAMVAIDGAALLAQAQELAAPAMHGLVLVNGTPNLKVGSARSVAWQALVASQGQPRHVVLHTLALAETQWHQQNGRIVKGIAPGGWLRTFAPYISWAPQQTPKNADTAAPAPEVVQP